MVRIQLHLTEDQDERLRKLARASHATRAELIRRGIDLVLAQGTKDTDPLLGLIGAAGPAGRPDISEEHDAVLYVRERPDDE